MNKPNKLSEQSIRQLFANCADIQIMKHDFGGPKHIQSVLLIYCEGMAEMKQINQYVLPRLKHLLLDTDFTSALDRTLQLTSIEQPNDMATLVFSGQLVFYFINQKSLYTLDIANPPHRTTEESNTEISIKGPRDGFVEELQMNVALVRKRLRTNSLCYEQFTIGKRSRSKVALLYIDDIIQPDIIKEARARLQKIDIDYLVSNQLEQILSDTPSSLFPTQDYTGRPDFIVDCLLRGRFAILVDGSPTAIIAPTNLTLLLKSPEDAYHPYYYVTFELFLRFIGLAVSLLLPGFWIALSAYNMEQLPFPLLSTVALSRLGLPMPSPLEAILMVGLFELFREAGARLPKSVGQTVAVVGGIIVGDAAIRAGLASTTMLVVAAVTAVATFTLVNQTLAGTVSIIRLFVLLCASFLGMYGFILSVMAIVLYLSTLESFGIPYLSPLSPIKWKDILAALIRKPWYKSKQRPEIMQTEDSTRQGGNT